MTEPVPNPAPNPGPNPGLNATPRLVVALDGPASSGKSSVGAAAAARLGLRFVDTGLVYRAMTAMALREGVATDDAVALVPLAARVSLGDDGTGRLTRVLLDGEDATEAIRSDAVDAAVSAVSRVPEVRAALLGRQRALAADGGIVVAGRDIGTVVLPDAGLKVFLDASVEERAARRIAERGLPPEGIEAALVRAQLQTRDDQDRNRAVAPLRAADDALHIVTDGHTFAEAVDLVVAAISAAERGSRGARVPGKVPAEDPGTKPRRNRVLEAAYRLDNDQTMLVRMVGLVTRIGARLIARVQVDGLENIPRTGAVILAVNHISNADPVVSGAWITGALHRRRIHWLGKKELFAWPGFGWIAAHCGVHPVDRGTADVEAFRLATRILEAGYVLLVFPEGTRSPTGELQEAKDGIAMLAIRTGAQVVPIGVNNSDAVWPKGQKLPAPFPRRTITVRIGAPFRVEDVVPANTNRRAAKGLATAAIMGRIAGLLEPRHRGVYADAIRFGASREP